MQLNNTTTINHNVYRAAAMACHCKHSSAD